MDNGALGRGAGTVLDLFGSTERDELAFEYEGKDLEHGSADQALISAWRTMGELMTDFMTCHDPE